MAKNNLTPDALDLIYSFDQKAAIELALKALRVRLPEKVKEALALIKDSGLSHWQLGVQCSERVVELLEPLFTFGEFQFLKKVRVSGATWEDGGITAERAEFKGSNFALGEWGQTGPVIIPLVRVVNELVVERLEDQVFTMLKAAGSIHAASSVGLIFPALESVSTLNVEGSRSFSAPNLLAVSTQLTASKARGLDLPKLHYAGALVVKASKARIQLPSLKTCNRVEVLESQNVSMNELAMTSSLNLNNSKGISLPSLRSASAVSVEDSENIDLSGLSCIQKHDTYTNCHLKAARSVGLKADRLAEANGTLDLGQADGFSFLSLLKAGEVRLRYVKQGALDGLTQVGSINASHTVGLSLKNLLAVLGNFEAQEASDLSAPLLTSIGGLASFSGAKNLHVPTLEKVGGPLSVSSADLDPKMLQALLTMATTAKAVSLAS